MTHVHHFSVMVVDNGFVVKGRFRPQDKTVTLVAKNEDELVDVLKKYIEERKTTLEDGNGTKP